MFKNDRKNFTLWLFIFYFLLMIYIELNKKIVIARKTVYGKCPRCRTKSQLEIITNNPGKEKFKCNICFQMFGINEM